MVLNQPVGVPKSNPTDYTGPTMCLVPIKRFPREPLVSDKRYRIGQFAILGRDPSTGIEGDLWYLANFFPNGDAHWIQFVAEVVVGQTLTADSGGPLSPIDGNWNIFGDAPQGSVTSGAGNTITITNTDATEIQIGVSELATDAETIDGTDTTRVIVPSALTAKLGDQTSEGIAFGKGTNLPLSWTAGLTDGQLAIGDTAGIPAAANLTEGVGLTITNGPNSITIDALSTTKPSFFARNNANQNGITGNGTTYIVEYKNVTLDQGGDFDGTSVFTAPIAGNYVFQATVQIISLAASAMGVTLSMVSTGINKRASVINGEFGRSGASNTILLNGQLFIDMDVGDTCHVTIQVDGMPADTVDLSSFTGNTFAGYLDA